jgi:AcrR family transcriptional regulator
MQDVMEYDKAYPRVVPKLWKDTVEEHRRDVRTAILDAAWRLASERGLLGVTMAQVAEHAGIGRATLYKYFGGVEAILVAAHAEHVDRHLAELQAARAAATSADEALSRLLQGYARICFHRGTTEAPDLHALVHDGERHGHSQARLVGLFADAVAAAQQSGAVRTDVKSDELASYCVHALEAAGELTGAAAVDRLVAVVAAGLSPLARE